MLDRFTQGYVPPKAHAAARRNGRLLFEHCFTRDGFDGPFSILYHQQAPTHQARVERMDAPWPVSTSVEGAALLRHHYVSPRVPAGATPITSRVPLFFNEDVVMYVARPTRSDEVYYSNSDGDDLYYIQHGTGVLESPFGDLRFEPGDYVLVPRAVLHRFKLDTEHNHWFITEGASIGVPAAYRNPVGQLRMESPYSHRDFVRPTLRLDGEGWGVAYEGPAEVWVKREGAFTRHVYASCPLDVVGWDGTVYPFKLPIRNFQPKVSSYHLPPNLHGTFQGSRFVVCSFVPRMVDFGQGAIPCPYPHSNVHCDEILFYDQGHFTSRRGIVSGSISFHPGGLPHGPQPGAYEASIGKSWVDELAVMVDTFRPLNVTPQALLIEDPDYQQSWMLPPLT